MSPRGIDIGETSNATENFEDVISLTESKESTKEEKIDLEQLLANLKENKDAINSLRSPNQNDPSKNIHNANIHTEQITELINTRTKLLEQLRMEVQRIKTRIEQSKKVYFSFLEGYNKQELKDEHKSILDEFNDHKQEYIGVDIANLQGEEKVKFETAQAAILQKITQFVLNNDPGIQKLSYSEKTEAAKTRAITIYAEKMGYTNLVISSIQLETAQEQIAGGFLEEGIANVQSIQKNVTPNLQRNRADYQKDRENISQGFLDFLKKNPDLERTNPSLAQRILFSNALEKEVLARQQAEKVVEQKAYKEKKRREQAEQITVNQITAIPLDDTAKKTLTYVSNNGGADIIINALTSGNVVSENNNITIPYDSNVNIHINQQDGSMHVGNIPVDSLEPEAFDTAYTQALLSKEYSINKVPFIKDILTHVFGVQAKDGNRMTPEQGKAVLAFFKALGAQKETNTVIENTLQQIGIVNNSQMFLVENARTLHRKLVQTTNFDPQKIERLRITDIQNML